MVRLSSIRQRFTRLPPVQKAVRALDGIVGSIHARNYDVGRSIVILGTPRSGTNWLCEILARATGFPTIEEPYNPAALPPELVRRLGLTWRPYLRPDAGDPEALEFHRSILVGKLLRPSCAYRDARSVWALLRGAPLIVRCIRANFLVPYLNAKFPGSRKILLVRSPFSVIASQLVHGDWSAVELIEPHWAPVCAEHPEFNPLTEARSQAQALAVSWCLEYAFLEKHRPWLAGIQALLYEDLYREPHRSLLALFHFLDIPWREDFLRFVTIRSRSVRPGSALLSGEDPTSHHRDVLSERQHSEIVEVLERFQALWPGRQTFFTPWLADPGEPGRDADRSPLTTDA